MSVLNLNQEPPILDGSKKVSVVYGSPGVPFANDFQGAMYWYGFGFNVGPLDPITKSQLFPISAWRSGLQAGQIAEHWTNNPASNVACLLGDSDIIFIVKNADALAALTTLEKRFNVLPKLVIETRTGAHHYFKRGCSTGAKTSSYSTAKSVAYIGIATGDALILLPPSAGYVVAARDVENVSELTEVTPEFISAVMQHNQRITDATNKHGTDVAEVPIESTGSAALVPDSQAATEDRLAVATEIAKSLPPNVIEANPEAVSDAATTVVSLDAAIQFTKTLIATTATDCGAPFEPEAIKALAKIYLDSPADYHRIRGELKQLSRNVSVVALDHAVKREATKLASSDAVNAQTHHGYANDILAELTIANWAPVGYGGVLWVLNADSNLWEIYELDQVERLVAERHDGKDFCARRSDYSSIALHALKLASDPTFFTDAAIGIACPGGFLQVNGDVVELVPLTPNHRQRVMLPFAPAALPTPMFNQFLHETFACPDGGEMNQQISLVQEIIGATMIGVMPRFQKAVKLYEPYGRAGKGTLMQITTQLVPAKFVRAVSPFKWDDEYYVAMLAGARLNVVGELPDDKPIPAAAFKTLIGGDLLTGRHPAGRPISFKNSAAHIFMTNHLITTKDQSEAFFTRWLLVEFPNSRLRLGLPIDTTLAERIISGEMPGIAYWALQGAVRLLRNGKFSSSAAHDRLMTQWRKSTNSLEEFIDDVCTVGVGLKEKRSDFYRCYAGWCKQNGRRPFAKGKVKDLLAYNVGLGVSLVEIDGHETFKGLQVKPDFKSSVCTF